MTWSPSPAQERVLDEARAWLDDPAGDQIKYLAGYAGSGKTTLANHLVEGLEARFCAFTGKAALVLRDKGCEGASTIHQLIYRPVEILGSDAEGMTRTVEFDLCPDSELAIGGIDVVVADECSMIDERTARDLLSFGIKVLVLGDPFQLPPVSGRGAFADVPPTWLLTEVHRQARESGVLRLATDVREGRAIDMRHGAYGDDVAVVGGDAFASVNPLEVLESVGQILVGTNASRHALNTWARQALGRVGAPRAEYPVPGDKLVCLRNNHKLGLMNGGQWLVKRSRFSAGSSFDGPHLELRIESLDEADIVTDVTAWPNHFVGTGDALKRVHWTSLREHQEFDYAYAMTVHKSQGSQWDSVFLRDESDVFGEHAPRHLYTGITRAAKQIVLVR